MSIFPTQILLATDGSEEARQAAQAAAELSKETGSVVHIAYVVPSLAELRGHTSTPGRSCVRSSIRPRGRPGRSSRSRPRCSGLRGGGCQDAPQNGRAGQRDSEAKRGAGRGDDRAR